MDERPWYSGFFDDDYLRVFGPVLPEERTADEVNGVVGQLGLAPGGRLLDLCCGQGRHFDAVVNLFHAFGYLEDEAQDELVLAEVARVLAPGGRFLQELANREAVVRGWHDSDVARHPDGRQATREVSIRLYTLTELEVMLGRAGLELLAVSGDLDGDPLELDSSFVVTLSRRAGQGIS